MEKFANLDTEDGDLVEEEPMGAAEEGMTSDIMPAATEAEDAYVGEDEEDNIERAAEVAGGLE